jgi:hypothetical protein
MGAPDARWARPPFYNFWMETPWVDQTRGESVVA